MQFDSEMALISRSQMKPIFLHDNGGRRSGVDRRQFIYAVHIPERRDGKERRSGKDRRAPRPFNEAINPHKPTWIMAG